MVYANASCLLGLIAHSTLLLAARGDAGSSSGTSTAPPLAGQHEDIEGSEIVWQRPEGQQTKGILLAFHGCSHGAIDWWPKSTTCPTCIGLPEEVLITSTALSRGYAVVAVSSRDREHRRCWSIPHQPQSHTVDTLAVAAVVSVLQQREAFQGLPLYALGASSGGAFALTLAAHLPLSALCSQIMALPGTWYKAFLEGPAGAEQQQGKGWHEAPVLFVHMPRDAHTAARVKECVELRQTKGLSTHVIEVQPQPLTEALLTRVSELTQEAAKQLLALFTAQSLVDSSGLLVEDPRSTQWRAVVQQSGLSGLAGLKLTPDQSGLSEVLNMAYASHEIIADTTGQMLDWFEAQPKATHPN